MDSALTVAARIQGPFVLAYGIVILVTWHSSMFSLRVLWFPMMTIRNCLLVLMRISL